MCGRHELSENPAVLRARFNVPDVPQFHANIDLRPTDPGVIIRRNAGNQREGSIARWGLVPYWAQDLKLGSRCFNARAETIATTPAFRAAFRQRRCLVPATAFYEWTGVPGRKTRHRIALPSGEPMALAGLWERWRHRATNENVESYTIVTCEPNKALSAIHDRMPVIIAESDFENWLAGGASKLLKPYAGGLHIEPAA
ncbi:MAG TPA: SOS response-associated peptidase [Burkholderiaceae bacterium]|nr:SOS response-associated peptidase [Burkholderiaceae bacterium]